MKLKLKETFAKLIEASLRSTTFTATTDANGYVHLPVALNGAIPVWAEVSGNPGRPCFLRNSMSDLAKYGLRFKAWDDTVYHKSSTITVTVYYLWVGGVLRNPVISRLTAIFTSLLFGGDVDEAVVETGAGEIADTCSKAGRIYRLRNTKPTMGGSRNCYIHIIESTGRCNCPRRVGVQHTESSLGKSDNKHTRIGQRTDYILPQRVYRPDFRFLVYEDNVSSQLTISERRWSA